MREWKVRDVFGVQGVLSAEQEAKLAELASQRGWSAQQVAGARGLVAEVLHALRAFGPRRSVRAAAEQLRIHPSLVEDVLGRDFRVAA